MLNNIIAVLLIIILLLSGSNLTEDMQQVVKQFSGFPCAYL